MKMIIPESQKKELIAALGKERVDKLLSQIDVLDALAKSEGRGWKMAKADDLSAGFSAWQTYFTTLGEKWARPKSLVENLTTGQKFTPGESLSLVEQLTTGPAYVPGVSPSLVERYTGIPSAGSKTLTLSDFERVQTLIEIADQLKISKTALSELINLHGLDTAEAMLNILTTPDF